VHQTIILSAFSTKGVYTSDDVTKRYNMSGTFPTFEDLFITENDVMKFIQKLNPTKAAGPDIKPWV
jgi:hypothetical protein